MQKKLIALAVAGAFAAPLAAHADSGNVTIYGKMSVSYDYIDAGYTNGQSSQNVSQINDNQSYIGFKGSEDLGNGLSAVWQIESGLNADGATPTTEGDQGRNGSVNSNGTLNSRNTFVGLSGKTWGTVILGRHDTPYKLATRSLDMFADGIADNRSIMGMGAPNITTFDGRQSNVLAYISPNLNGFTFAVGYVAGAENAYNTTGGANNNKGDAWSVMGNYSNGPWYGALAYERHNIGTGGSGTLGFAAAPLGDKEEHAWKIGGGYKANNFRVGLEYEKTDDNFGDGTDPLGCGQSSCFGHHAWNLGAGYTFGNNEVKFQYTQAGDLDSVSNSGAKQYTLGIDHNFSKRTKIFALYTKLNNDTNAAYSLVGASNGGVVNNLLTGLGADSDPSAVSIGMAHSF